MFMWSFGAPNLRVSIQPPAGFPSSKCSVTLPNQQRGPKDHINTRISHFGPGATMSGIPEIMLCRSLMFMWSFGALKTQVLNLAPVASIEPCGPHQKPSKLHANALHPHPVTWVVVKDLKISYHIKKPHYLVYFPKMVAEIKFLNSKPVCMPGRIVYSTV